jgi:hypothetical protein
MQTDTPIPAADPLAVILARLASAATSPAVRLWAARLAEHGEAASSTPAVHPQPAATAEGKDLE